MSDCKAVATPGEVNLKLVKSDDEEQKLVDPKLYKSLVGSLLFIGKQTRSDILHIVKQLSRFLDKPNESHWKAAKHVLRYLKGTIDLRLTFLKNSNFDIIGDSDADWSADLNDRKSTTGYYFKFEGNGGAISWEVKKQATVALSSAEAEYQATENIHTESYLSEKSVRCFFYCVCKCVCKWRHRVKYTEGYLSEKSVRCFCDYCVCK